jgi:hypothetical protein
VGQRIFMGASHYDELTGGPIMAAAMAAGADKVGFYLISSTSFSFALLISSIFLISSSVSF